MYKLTKESTSVQELEYNEEHGLRASSVNVNNNYTFKLVCNHEECEKFFYMLRVKFDFRLILI